MISDCDELQKNRTQNDPLTVKTPPPLHWFPSYLVDAGRQVAGALSPADPPAASLPSSGLPAMLPDTGANSSRARSPANPCGARLPGECRKGTETSIHQAKVRQIDRGSRAGSRAGRRSFPRSKWAKVGQGVPLPSCPPALLPSCPAPAIHPNAQPMHLLLHDRTGRRSGGAFPFRYRKRLSRYNT